MAAIIALGILTAATTIRAETSASLHHVPPQRETIDSLVQGIGSGWAVFDSLVLAAAYIPAAVVLRSRLRAYASEVDLKAPPSWFDKEWLVTSPLQEVSRLMAILAPFLVGKASDIAALLG